MEVHLPAMQHEKPKAGKAWAVSVPSCIGWDICQDGSKGKVKSDADPLHSSARLCLCGICADRWGGFLEVGGRTRNEGRQLLAWKKRKAPSHIPMSQPSWPGGRSSGEKQKCGNETNCFYTYLQFMIACFDRPFLQLSLPLYLHLNHNHNDFTFLYSFMETVHHCGTLKAYV